MSDANEFLAPGMLVQHPGRPEWGIGQVQSRINSKVTVMFEHAGKVVIDGKQIVLEPYFPSDGRPTRPLG